MNTHTVKDAYGTWSITLLPDSQVFGWSHAVEIFQGFRGQGLGQTQHKQRLRYAKHSLRLSRLLCSVEAFNENQKHILKKMGWVPVIDQETNCEILWMKDLDKDETL